MKPKCIFYFGHRSSYGQSFLEPLLKNSYLDIQEVVVADLERWFLFSAALSGEPVNQKQRSRISKENRIYLKHVESVIHRLKPGIKIRQIHSANAEDETRYLKNAQYDLGISVAFPQIFKKSFIESFGSGAINFHPSYLPRCRGAHPVYWTIARNEPFGGTTCHYLTEKLDQGPVIAQIKLPVTDDTYYKGLYNEIVNSSDALVSLVEDFFRNKKHPEVQVSEFSYHRNDRKIHRKVYWQSEDAPVIHAKVRAGKAFSFIGRHMIVWKTVKHINNPELTTNHFESVIEAGTILQVKQNEVIVFAKGGILQLTFYVVFSNLLQRLFHKIIPVKISVGEKLN